ncbi:hypothetical protein AB0H17_09400 [Streptomyces olivoreticuli]
MFPDHLSGDLVTTAVFLRVFGRDALALLRRAMAAGVLMGVSELDRAPARSTCAHGGGRGTGGQA